MWFQIWRHYIRIRKNIPTPKSLSLIVSKMIFQTLTFQRHKVTLVIVIISITVLDVGFVPEYIFRSKVFSLSSVEFCGLLIFMRNPGICWIWIQRLVGRAYFFDWTLRLIIYVRFCSYGSDAIQSEYHKPRTSIHQGDQRNIFRGSISNEGCNYWSQ